MICLTLAERTLEDAASCVKKNREYIDLCELRLDYLDDKEQKRASLFPQMVDLPVILTFRRIQDGGKCSISEKGRRSLMFQALDGSFSYVDIEEDVKRSEVEEKARSKGIRIIRSLHDFERVPEDIFSRLYHLAEKGDIAKVAVTPRSFQDVLTLFRVEEELKGVEKIVIGMGDYGVCTRILYKRLGSMLTFVSANEVAPGQISAEKMKIEYRADQVNERTAIYGIIGNPVMHSASPVLHNRGFKAINFNAIYVPFLVDNVRSFFMFAEYVKMRGFSVTVPFKVDVLSYLDKIPVCVAYQVGDKRTDNFPTGEDLENAKPIYDYLPGWKCDISRCRRVQDLPRAALDYIHYLEKAVGCRITYVSVGAERDQYLVM